MGVQRKVRMFWGRVAMAGALSMLVAFAHAGKDPLYTAVSSIDANVVFMRHALAPGFGDPDDFQINDCSTQRNLNAAGQDQARSIGRQLAGSAVQFSAILSSEWCRCRDTARLLGLGDWEPYSGLNSFFQDHADRTQTLSLLRQRLNQLPSGVTLMVTHQVVISAITGKFVGSGELIAYNTKSGRSAPVRIADN